MVPKKCNNRDLKIFPRFPLICLLVCRIDPQFDQFEQKLELALTPTLQLNTPKKLYEANTSTLNKRTLALFPSIYNRQNRALA